MLKYSIAALALVAGSSLAVADPNNGGPGAGSSSAGGAMQHSGSMSGGATTGNGEMKMKESGASSKEMRSGEMKGDRSQASDNGAGSMQKQKPDRQQASDEKGNGSKSDRQAEDNNRKMKPDQRADRNDRNDRKASDQAKDQSRADKSATGASEGTEGKARPKGSLTNINPEQKTRVISAFSDHRVAPARDIGVAVNVGVVVPRSVHFYPIPDEIVSIVPDYRGYEYFMIDDSHVAVVDPDSLEVVDIIVIA
jgi:hypothetical protein